jgi:hypothetical protein
MVFFAKYSVVIRKTASLLIPVLVMLSSSAWGTTENDLNLIEAAGLGDYRVFNIIQDMAPLAQNGIKFLP